MPDERQWENAVEPQYPSVRWNEVARDADEAKKTVYLGPQIQGILIGRKSGVGANDSCIYNIQLADGTVVAVWGSTVLDPKMAMVPDASEVRIIFEGLQKAKVAGRKPWKKFSVQFAKPVTTFQEAVPPTQTQPGAAPTAAPVATTPSDEGY